MTNKESEENSNYSYKNLFNSYFFSPNKNTESNNEKKYKKIQLSNKLSKNYLKINDSKRFFFDID